MNNIWTEVELRAIEKNSDLISQWENLRNLNERDKSSFYNQFITKIGGATSEIGFCKIVVALEYLINGSKSFKSELERNKVLLSTENNFQILSISPSGTVTEEEVREEILSKLVDMFNGNRFNFLVEIARDFDIPAMVIDWNYGE